MKRTIAGATAGIVAAVAIGYGNFTYAESTNADFHNFQSSICSLSSQQARNGAAFKHLLATLEQRAVAREHIDAQAGNATAAAADADSARLYQTVLTEYANAAKHPVSLDC